jgi:CheY-like chemotaxis protein
MSVIKKPLLGVRVLLVDDDDDACELFAFALQEAGADVRTASDAKEALRIALEFGPHVLVSDLCMPSMDGRSLLREIRSVAPLSRTPAIAVSGLAGRQDRAAALEVGFQDHLAKPLAPDELVAVVGRWAQTNRCPAS